MNKKSPLSSKNLKATAAAFLVAAVAAGLAQPASAQASCNIRILHGVTDDIGNRWRPGQILPVDIARDSTTGGAFCAHGGSCIPRRVAGTQAARLINCHIGALIGGNDHRLVWN